MHPLLSVGHSTHPADRFAGLLRGAGVEAVVDVRIGPGSRRSPHFQRFDLERWLPESGFGYRWERRLGGFRTLPADSPDIALRNASFRAYAAHMRGAEFRAALAELLDEAADRRIAIMCSEALWWRCHRRMIADAAQVLHGWDVQHVMPDGRLAAHRPTAGVRAVVDELYYDQ